jgi:hypothetical protein
MHSLYEDLPLRPNDIRLLTILKGEKNAPLACSLEVVPFGDFSRHPEGVYQWSTGYIWSADWYPEVSQKERVQWIPIYEALSYTWGDAVNKVPLKVNQSEEPVTTNLYSALFALRLENQDRPLWVDALCINQNDIEERNNQVQRMQSTYQRATRTLVWLGEADDTSDLAFYLLERLGGSGEEIAQFRSPPTMDFAGPQYDPVYGLGDAERDYIAYFKSFIDSLGLIGIVDLDDNDWAALENLFSRPYWKRIWIVQEITNAHSVEIHCGSNSLSWQTIDRIELNKKTIKDISLPLRTVERYTSLFAKGAIRRIMNQRKWTRHYIRSQGLEHSSTSFLNLLERFRDFNCTDPRDKIYALLGLASIDKNMPLPKPDYSKSVSEVYCATARAIIQYTRDLTILCLPKSYKGLIEHHLPFWCPDWTTQPDEVYVLRDSGTWPTFKSAGATLPQGPDFNFDMNSFDENGEPIKKRLHLQTKKSLWVAINGGSEDAIPSTIRHPEIEIRSLDATNNHNTLILKGHVIDRILEMGRAIPKNAFKTDAWKEIIVGWEALLDKLVIIGYHHENHKSPEAKKLMLKSFILTLCRGVIHRDSSETDENEIEVLYEFYLIWTGRLCPSEAKNARSNDHFTKVMFEDLLLQYIGKWKMVLGWKGRLLLVPEDAEERDCVTVLFGADAPLVLRPSFQVRGTGQIGWQHVGTVYGMDLMRGEGLYLAKMENSEALEFALF